MATAPAVAYLGDTNQYIDWCNKWGVPYYHRVATFQGGTIGEKCQLKTYGGVDAFDADASQSTYSNEVLFNGKQVCKMHCPAGGHGSKAFGGTFEVDVGARRGQEVWSQATLYFPSVGCDFEEVADGGGGWKLMRQRVTNKDYSVGHADIYINSMSRSTTAPFYFNMEAHTSTSNGHSPHNGASEIGDRATWDIPRDQWVDIQYYTLHDVDQNGTTERTRLMCWVGDTLLADVNAAGSNLRRYTMIGDTDYVQYASLCTYINAFHEHGHPEHGVDNPQTWYCAAYEVTNKRPEYTDAAGNPKLPPRVV